LYSTTTLRKKCKHFIWGGKKLKTINNSKTVGMKLKEKMPKGKAMIKMETS
jgi:hypothetical protein